MSTNVLSSGVVLVEDHERIDYQVTVPAHGAEGYFELDLAVLTDEPARRGVELVEDEECEWERLPGGWLVCCASVAA